MPNPISTSTNLNNRTINHDLRNYDTVNQETGDPFAALPTETEIYILPGGEVIIADLPSELAERLLPRQADSGHEDTRSDLAHTHSPGSHAAATRQI
jgi:hypothetical protein